MKCLCFFLCLFVSLFVCFVVCLFVCFLPPEGPRRYTTIPGDRSPKARGATELFFRLRRYNGSHQVPLRFLVVCLFVCLLVCLIACLVVCLLVPIRFL